MLPVGEELHGADGIEAPGPETTRRARARGIEHHLGRTRHDRRRPAAIRRQALGVARPEPHRLRAVGRAQHHAVRRSAALADVHHQQLPAIGGERAGAGGSEPGEIALRGRTRHTRAHAERKVLAHGEPAAIGRHVVHDEPGRRAQHRAMRRAAIAGHGHRLHLPAAGGVAREDERAAIARPCQPFDGPELGRERAGGAVSADDHHGAAIVEAPRMRHERHSRAIGRDARIAQIAGDFVPGRADRMFEPVAAVAEVVHDGERLAVGPPVGLAHAVEHGAW